MDYLNQADKILNTATDAIDDNFESDQERQQTLTERLRIDTTSPYKLPHLIRPIAFIWAMGMFTILSVLSLILTYLKPELETLAIATVMGSITTILTAIVGFYFQSRKHEKISLERNKTALKIEELKTKHEIREDKLDSRQDRKRDKKGRFLRRK